MKDFHPFAQRNNVVKCGTRTALQYKNNAVIRCGNRYRQQAIGNDKPMCFAMLSTHLSQSFIPRSYSYFLFSCYLTSLSQSLEPNISSNLEPRAPLIDNSYSLPVPPPSIIPSFLYRIPPLLVFLQYYDIITIKNQKSAGYTGGGAVTWLVHYYCMLLCFTLLTYFEVFFICCCVAKDNGA